MIPIDRLPSRDAASADRAVSAAPYPSHALPAASPPGGRAADRLVKGIFSAQIEARLTDSLKNAFESCQHHTLAPPKPQLQALQAPGLRARVVDAWVSEYFEPGGSLRRALDRCPKAEQVLQLLGHYHSWTGALEILMGRPTARTPAERNLGLQRLYYYVSRNQVDALMQAPPRLGELDWQAPSGAATWRRDACVAQIRAYLNTHVLDLRHRGLPGTGAKSRPLPAPARGRHRLFRVSQ